MDGVENKVYDMDEISRQYFLIYANSVIKSRAIPYIEDNLKPIHRKILYTLYKTKLTSDKEAKKSMATVGEVLKLSPHGDTATYGAAVRLAQWWKLRYPLVEMQGNCGNILGDGPAAARYTNMKLSPLGDYMLKDIDKDCVDFKPNYDESMMEPVTLPSAFPYILCGNNSGIAVGMSSDIVSHNFTEVAAAIKYYMAHKECTIADLMQFIKGPDFPTGGLIRNGEDLLNIYSTGKGAIEVYAHYDISKKANGKILLTFHDVPYGVDIEPGIKTPLKKLVNEEGYDAFENYNVEKVGPHNFDIQITLSKSADLAKCLDVLFKKTGLRKSVKINQTFIVDGEPKVLSLKDMIATWVNYRSNIIKRIAQNDYDRTNHKLTITIGLQKCMSNIDRVIEIIRNAVSGNEAKILLMKEFELSAEQADAVLDIKLARLSHLEVEELNKDEKKLKDQLAALKNLIENEEVRYQEISKSLDEIKKVVGEDKRLTEIQYNRPIEEIADSATAIKRLWYIHTDGLHGEENGKPVVKDNLATIVEAYSPDDIIVWSKDGEVGTVAVLNGKISGATTRDEKRNKIVVITKGGNIKVSAIEDYKLKSKEKALKLKEGDEIKALYIVNDNDSIILFDGDHALRLRIGELPVAGKNTTGTKSGLINIVDAALVTNDNQKIFMMNKDGKAKYAAATEFSIGTKGNKGITTNEGIVRAFTMLDSRSELYLTFEKGSTIAAIDASKPSLKGKTALGAKISNRLIKNVY